jgi:hypothetical protein
MRIALITTLWRRHDLTKIVLNYYRQFPNLELICVGSEGEKSKQLAEGWHYIEHKNFPVSEKHNQALKNAKDLNVDGVVLIGSDDLMSKELFTFYQTLDKNCPNVIGFEDSHIYYTETKELFHYTGLVFKQTVGTGRFFSKYVLDRCGWELWDNNLNRGLDTNCTNKLKKMSIFETVYKLSDINGFFVDIKHTENITKFGGFGDRLNQIDFKIMAKKLGKKVVEEIAELPKPSDVIKANPLEKGKMYTFISNGTSKHMKKGDVYEISGETAMNFISKGYGDIS